MDMSSGRVSAFTSGFIRLATIVATCALSMGLIQPAWAVVGVTAGSAGVSSAGAATYNIPLVLPPGTNGLTPQLALVYNHQTGEGISGVGWNLAGLSAITRCDKTYVQDGAPAQVLFTTADRFCLDGNQLKLVSGSYGVSGSTYRTEIDTVARITASGTAGNGPASFTVEQKNGLIYEYGNSTDSRVETLSASYTTTARSWVLTKIRDRATNAITFSYTEDGSPNGAYRISSISYTSNSTQGTSAAYTVSFTYDTHPSGDVTVGYLAGGLVKDTKRLTRIDAVYNATSALIRRYNLTYEGSVSSTGRSRLASIQECAGATPDCLASTTFTYTDGTNGYGSETSSGTTLASAVTALPIDINGDGRTDLVYSSSTGAGTWMYRLANTSGTYDTAVNSGITNTNFGQAIAIDYTGDGFEDLMYPGTGSTWWVIQGSASGLVAAVNTSITNQSISGQAIAIDMNGDGLDDLVYVESSTGSVKVRYRLNPPGSGSFASSATTLYTATHGFINITALIGNGQNRRSRARDIDINGDGMRDLALLIQEVTTDPPDTQYTSEVILGAGGGTVYPMAAGNSYPALFMDINGDGLTDIVYDIGAGTLRYQFSNGLSFGSQVTGPSLTNLNFSKALVRDWDGDGYDDLLLPNTSTATWYVMRSTGEALSTASNTSLSVSSPQAVYSSADLNGDGLDDIVYANSSNVLVSRLHSGVMPDLLATATDGYGVGATFAYLPLSNSSGAYAKGNTATYPQQEYQGPRYVARTATLSNGIGGTYTLTYSYTGARLDLQGRGFLGFDLKKTYDSRNSVSLMEYFKRDFPYIGLLYQRDLIQPNGSTVMHRVVNTLSNSSTGSNPQTFYFPYVSQTVETRYEVGGTYNGNLISTATTTNTIDSTSRSIYDSTTTTVEAGTANGVQSAASYVQRVYHPTGNLVNDTTNWCLGRPGQTQPINSHSQYGGGSITLTTNRTWDGPTCRITQEVAEPGSGSWQITRNIGYDGWGNVNSDAVTGVSMSARTTTASYSDNNGRFPASVTNPLSQATTFGWDAAKGLMTSQTDPNGLATSWQYDDLGRRMREDRPDGTATIWTLYLCVSPSYCGDSLLRFYIQTDFNNTSNATFRYDRQFFDSFNRLKYDEPQLMGGDWGYALRLYDSLGRLTQESAPTFYSAPTMYWATYQYDLLNRPTQASRPVSDSDPTLQTTYSYYEGLTTRIVDPLSKQTTKVANVVGGLAKSIDHDSYAQIFDYDSFWNAVRVTDSASNTLQSITYNVRGMRTAMADMDMGSWGFTPNALGELVSQTDAKSQTTTFAYDGLGRLTSRVETEGTSTWTWGASSGSKNIGRLASVSGPGYSESYTYDSVGRPSTRSISSDASYSIDYSYNNIGKLDTLTYPTSTSSYRLKLQYDYQYGHLLRVKDYNAPTTVFWVANATDARGKVIDETLGNGLQTTVGVDQVTGLVDSIYTGSGGSIQNLAYTWDRAGNLTQRQDVRQSLTEAFYYDNLHRLDYSTLNGSTNVDYTYNSLGNLTYKSDVGSYTYDATRKHAVTAAGSFSFAYDGNGNASTRNGSSITWYSYNLPNTISASGSNSSQFFYAPDRSRWKQVASYAGTAETSIYIGGLIEKVTLGATTSWKHSIAGGTGPVAVYTRKSDLTNQIHYLTKDHLGSVDSITNGSGTIEVRLSYASFGQRRNESGWTGNPTGGDWTQITATSRHGFTSHEMLDNLSLTHMNGRVYDQVVGRFLSGDPYIPTPDYTQSFNRYAYVRNNPLASIDPSGFIECPDWGMCVTATRITVPEVPAANNPPTMPGGGEAPPQQSPPKQNPTVDNKSPPASPKNSTCGPGKGAETTAKGGLAGAGVLATAGGLGGAYTLGGWAFVHGVGIAGAIGVVEGTVGGFVIGGVIGAVVGMAAGGTVGAIYYLANCG